MATVVDHYTRERTSPDQGRLPPGQERVGILSRTLNSSSAIRWILPARIRSPSKNDVVFVGNTFIQLQEFLDVGQLAKTTAKLDFGTTITDAKVISADLETVPIIDAILQQERDLEQFSIRRTTHNELIYVYAREDSVGDVRFVFAKRPFLRGADLPSSECRYVAVDPESRALAVASPSGYFGVFKLRSIDEIKSQIDGWNPQDYASFRPAEEQRFIQVDGNVLLMSFLPSPEADPTKVVLLLLASKGDPRETYQHLYGWDTRSPLTTIKPMRCSGRKLKDVEVPTMLIPSTRGYAYMVVMPSSITYYENVQSLEMKRANCEFAKDSKGNLEWVQWSRPRRHNKYLQRRDDIVLLREDGLVRNFLIDKQSSKKFSTNNTIGELKLSVDTAFCMLSGPPGKGGDTLIVGGSMTNGAVFHVSARDSPECVQTIETLAPLNDVVIGPPIMVDGADVVTQQAMPGRLYTCSGPHDGRGQLSEIRYGLEAQIGWTMEFPDAGMVDRLFSLEIPGARKLLLLASHTTNSSMVVYGLERQDLFFTGSESHPGFDFNHPTLAAIVINQDTVVQVTTAGITAILIEADDKTTTLGHLGAKFELAAFFEDDHSIAAVRREDTGAALCLLEVETAEDGCLQFAVNNPVRLEHLPNSICCFETGSDRLILIGTASGELLGYHSTGELVFEHRLQDLQAGTQTAAVSSLVTLSPKFDGPSLLLCGLRSGTVLCIEMKFNSSNGLGINARCVEVFQVGATTVQLVREQGRPRSFEHPSALVLCAYTTHRFTLHPNTAVVDYTFSPLWVTDVSNAAARPQINAVHRVPRLISGYDQPGGCLICAVEAELLFCSVVAQEHEIVQPLRFNGIPKRILYSQFLQKFAVAFSKEGIPYDPPARTPTDVPLLADEKDPADQPPKKIERIGLQLITTDLNFPTVTKEEDNTFSTIDLAAAAWSASMPKAWVKASLTQARKLSTATGNLSQPSVPTRSRPFLIACGKEVVLRHLDFKTRRWETSSRHPIPSQANAISSQGSLICVATKEHSLFVLVERNNQLQQHRCEGGMRYAKDIAVLDGSTAVFASSDAGGTDIIGFSGMTKETSDAIPLFHAKLPGHIRCFRQETSYGVHRSERTRFYGATIDGTIFHFSLLKQNEWELLHFVEEMSHMNRKAIKAVPMKMRDGENKEYMWKPPGFKPKDMHVRGDRLLMMIEEGPYNLRNVLNGSGRLASFNALATAVFGETEDPVDVAIAWMRKFLRYPPR